MPPAGARAGREFCILSPLPGSLYWDVTPPMKQAKNGNPWEMAGRYTALAMLLPAATFVGYAIGYVLDRWLGTKWIYLPCLLVGIAAGFVELVRELLKDTRDDNG